MQLFQKKIGNSQHFFLYDVFIYMTNRERKQKNRTKMAKMNRKINQKKAPQGKKVKP